MITSQHVTGEWVHVVDDGMVDEDALPDEARPTGSVRFDPVVPRIAEADGTAYTLTPVTALVADGQLRDLQGREGVWLAAQVGITPVLWRASTDVEYRGEDLHYPPVEFQLDGDMVLTARYGDDTEYPPPVVSAVSQLRDEAVAAAGRAEDAASDAEGHASAASGSASEAAGSAGAAASSASDASSSAGAAAGSESAAQGYASDASTSAGDAASSASAAASSASAASGSAGDASSSAADAQSSAAAASSDAGRAETAAGAFGLSAATSTGAPGTDAAVVVTGDGPAYSLEFTVPRGDQGEPGPPGEVSQAALDAAVASLVDGAPEALDTLSELAQALGHDPNFATTVSEAIGRRARIDGAPEQYDSLGKLVSALLAGGLAVVADWDNLTSVPSVFPPETHSHTIGDVSGLEDALDAAAGAATWDELDGKPSAFPPEQHTHTISDVSGLEDALDDRPTRDEVEARGPAIVRVTELPADPDPDTLYVVVEA